MAEARRAPAPSTPRAWCCRVALLSVALGLVAFGAALGFDFAGDDWFTIIRNKYLAWSLAPLLRACFSGAGHGMSLPDATRPLMLATTWLDRRVFELAPEGHHLHSLLWYAGSCAAAPCVAFALTRRFSVALVAAAFFAVSPVHAEAVAAVNYREDLISGLGVLVVIAWLFWPRAARDTVDAAAVMGGVALLGLFGKESALAIVPLALVGAAYRRVDRTWLRRRAPSLVGVGAALALWLCWRVGLRLLDRDGVPLAREPRGLGERLLRTCRFEARAVLDVLWPFSWSPDFPREGPGSLVWAVGLAGIVAVVLVLARFPRTRVLALGLAWALAAPLVVSPLLSPINERADRYLFVGVLGAGLFWAGLADLAARWVAAHVPHSARRRCKTFAPWVLAGSAGLLLLGEARAAAAPWTSDKVLWRVALERQPTAARAWVQFSGQLRQEGQAAEADRAVERAIALDPSFLRARVARLHGALFRGDVARARELILELERMGGSDQLGMRAARTCAALEPEAAKTCIAIGGKKSANASSSALSAP